MGEIADKCSAIFRGSWNRKLKRLIRSFLSLVLVASLFTVINVPTATAAGLTSCADGSGVTSGLTIAASHGQAFYIDSGVNPKLDAGYVGYRVTNSSGSVKKGLWVALTNFTGGKVTLANIDDQYMPLDDISNSGTKVAYFLLKASGASAAAQAHTVSIYDRRPDLAGATLQRSCSFSFSAVKETIKASANKVADNAAAAGGPIVVSDTTPELGQTISITVEGQTGNIGQGGTPDLDSIWLTPAAVSSWPTNALRLKSVSIKFDGNDNGWPANAQYSDQLLITSANGLTEVDQGYYIATYNFQVIGKPTASVLAVPVAQIASGTQMKHSDTTVSGSTATIDFSAGLTINQTLAKSVTATSGLETGTVSTISGASPGITYVAVPYKLELTTTGTTATVDEIVDTPGVGAIYYSDSGAITDNTRTAIAINAVYVSSESNLSPRPYHFVGPFTITSSRSLVITYKMWLPVGSTYVNNAYALIGNQKVGASASAIPNVSVNTTGGGGGSITQTPGTTTLDVAATTDPASGVSATAGTMNGTVDPNGTASTIKFQYGTSSSLSTLIGTVSASPSSSSSNDPVSASYALSGLTQGTTYYYRIIIYSSTNTVLAQGDITSFTTLVNSSSPTVTTLPASSITSSGATLNGNISPNNTLVTRIVFEYDSGSTISGGTTYVTLQDTSVSPAQDIQTSGIDLQNFSTTLTGLTTGTYVYRIIACTGSTSGSMPCGGGTSIIGSQVTFDLSKLDQTINFSSIANKTYGDSSFTQTTNANSNLQVSVTSLTTSVCDVTTSFSSPNTTITITIKSVGDCTLQATQSGNGSYNPAVTVQQTFYIGPAVLTVTAEDKSKTVGGSDPSFTSTISGFKTANGATDAATVSGAIYTFSGKSGYSYSPSTTPPSSAGIYSNDPSSATLSFTTGSASNYTIQYVAGTYTINAASKSNQTIVLDDYSTLVLGGTLNLDTLISNAGSGTGAITYTVASGDCSLSGTTLTANSGSSCVVTATKAGDANYNSATDNGTINLASPYTVTFNANGGTGSASSTSVTQATVGGAVTLATVGTLALSNSGFIGWATATSGGTFIAANSSYTPGSSLTLYAQWVTTGSSSNVTRTTADVAGTASLALTNPKFCYSSTNPGSSFDASTCTSSAASGTYTGYSASLSGLTANTTYYYQLTGTTGGATSYYGSVRTFTTLASYTITINSATGGSATTSAATVAAGGSVTLTATASSGYVFSSWTCTGGGTLNSSTANPATLSTINSNATCTPNFTSTYSVTINSATGGTATTSAATVNSGGSATLTATASSGYIFSSWNCTGGGSLNSSTANPATLSNITSNATCTPVFTATYTVTVGTLTNGGSSSISVATSPAVSGATITLTISPAAGLQLKAGTLAATPASGSTPSISGSGPYAFTMPAANVVVTAEFEAVPAGTYTINIATVTGGSGSSSAATVSSGGSVTLTATAASGYKFVSWSCDVGTLSNSAVSNPTLSNINGNATCTPSFTALVLYTVTFDANGGSGAASSTSVTQTAEGGSVTLATVGTLTNTYSGFIGWAIASSNGTFISANSSYTPASSITMFAQWVTTGGNSNVTSSGADLAGTATLALTNPKFCYSDSNPGASFNATTCTNSAASGTYAGFSVTLSGLLASTTYYYQLTGTTGAATSYYGTVRTFTTSAAASTYAITINSATGGSGSTSAATVSSGGSVTLTATAASGFTFSSWTCTGGGSLNSSTANPATLSSISADATCTPNFTANSSGGSNRNTTPASNKNVKIIVQKVATSNSGGNSTNNSPAKTVTTLTPTPSTTTTTTTTQTPTPGVTTSTITTTTVAPDGTKTTTTISGILSSNASSNGLTNSNGGVITALTNVESNTNQNSNGATVDPTNTTVATQMVVDSSVPASVVVNRGQDNKVQVQAVNGWTGRLSVAVVDEANTSDVQSYLEVVINPLPVTNVVVELPVATKKPEIKFDPSPSQVVKYEVQVNGKTVCESTATACAPGTLIGPKTKVDIITYGGDDTKSVVRLPAYVPPAPIPALTVYFAVGSAQLTKTEIKKLDKFVKEVKAAGFNRVVLEGHTDVQGTVSGYDNLTLSNNRAKQTAAYLRKFLKVKFSQDQFADTRPAVEGTDETAYKNNRRTEVSVW